MSGKMLRFSSAIGCAAVLLSLAGCAMATDLINPSFLSTLGIDPATIIRSQGRVVIAFQNSTSGVADFGAHVSSGLSATEQDSDVIYVEDVPANETRTMVVDCPAAVVTPLGSSVFGEVAGMVMVEYAGAPLVEGDDFFCGDVIEMRIVETGTGTADPVFDYRVQVLPGR
ncbi:MAG: hypothetical protein KKI02_08880 [Planctomycetes bacterium]|nr:hypothetical protein [Planctomycetota bacterium]